ncbi:multiheme c-type cytochrome [Lutibacter sp.]|uniref:multiheme c-type cytochrome n=1 Tax=Lutibacter sp. TaxID=1925666 RepID=UPI0035621469
MPKIIFRLLLSFIVFVTVFVLIQQYLTPNSFGKYGHYRADAIDDNKMRTSYYKGEESCVTCHQDVYDLKSEDVHDRVRCESCHFPKIAGSVDCEVMPPKVEGTLEFCAQCHAINLGRLKKGVPQLDFKEHKGDQNCIECHNVHAPWELKE